MTGDTALVPLDAARSELGIGRTTAYLQAKEHGELMPGLPLFRIRGRWYACRAQLERIKAGEIRATA